MQSLTQPTLLLKPFAQSGDRNDIPLVNNNLSNPQLADLTNGFPEITSRPPSVGGLPPERKDFNALGYLTTSYDWFYQAGGTFTFNQTISDAIGGYPLNARLWYTNEDGVSMIVRSTIQNNTNDFILHPEYIGTVGEDKPWVRDNFLGYVSSGNILDWKWTDHKLNDVSWLRGDTFSWQSGSVYVSAYNHIVDDYNNGTAQSETIGSYTISYKLAPDGHKITIDEENVINIYNATGAAWYYILDTTNQRFKLPRENPAREELIQVVRAKGNGITLGFYDGSKTYGCYGYNNDNVLRVRTNLYGTSIGTADTGTSTVFQNKTVGLATDPTKSGIVSDMADSTSVYKGKKYLYFYVGQYNQSAIEQTAGLNMELFNGKLDEDAENSTSTTFTNLLNKISGTDKEKIMTWGIPDYTAVISGISSPYTAPADGVVSWNNNGTANCTVNGNAFYVGGNDSYNEGNVTIFVSKGDIVSFSKDNGTACFAPLKGTR